MPGGEKQILASKELLTCTEHHRAATFLIRSGSLSWNLGQGKASGKNGTLWIWTEPGFKSPLTLVSPGSLGLAASALKAAHVGGRGGGGTQTMRTSQNPVGKMEHLEGGLLHTVGRGMWQSPLPSPSSDSTLRRQTRYRKALSKELEKNKRRCLKNENQRPVHNLYSVSLAIVAFSWSSSIKLGEQQP